MGYVTTGYLGIVKKRKGGEMKQFINPLAVVVSAVTEAGDLYGITSMGRFVKKVKEGWVEVDQTEYDQLPKEFRAMLWREMSRRDGV